MNKVYRSQVHVNISDLARVELRYIPVRGEIPPHIQIDYAVRRSWGEGKHGEFWQCVEAPATVASVYGWVNELIGVMRETDFLKDKINDNEWKQFAVAVGVEAHRLGS